MPRPASVVAATILALALGAVPSASAAERIDPPAPRDCESLPGRDLLPGNAAIRVSRVRYRTSADPDDFRSGHRWYACAGRSGTVRRLGESGNDRNLGEIRASAFLRLGRSAGAWLLYRTTDSADIGDFSSAWTALNVESGRRFTFWSVEQGEAGDSQELPKPSRTAVDAAGRVAAVFSTDPRTNFDRPPYSALPDGATAAVATFDASGRRVIRDTGGAEIVPASLSFVGDVVSWTHGTERRSVTVAAQP